MAKRLLRTKNENEEILRRNADTVYRIAFLRTENKHDAEDIMQEVFLRFVKHSPFFESQEHEKAWFIRTTLNRTNSFFTSAWRRRVVPLDENTKSFDEMSSSEILDAVMHLPKDISAAIHLYYYENMTIKEISSVIGKSESSIKSLLFRGRKLLRISLEDTLH